MPPGSWEASSRSVAGMLEGSPPCHASTYAAARGCSTGSKRSRGHAREARRRCIRTQSRPGPTAREARWKASRSRSGGGAETRGPDGLVPRPHALERSAGHHATSGLAPGLGRTALERTLELGAPGAREPHVDQGRGGAWGPAHLVRGARGALGAPEARSACGFAARLGWGPEACRPADASPPEAQTPGVRVVVDHRRPVGTPRHRCGRGAPASTPGRARGLAQLTQGPKGLRRLGTPRPPVLSHHG
jgi:hypothetical protein